MPCNCDHMHPTHYEEESAKLMMLLKEVGLVNAVPYYGKVALIDEHTQMLCDFCKNNDVTQYSLELQIWWRDHKKADEAKKLK